MLLLTFYAACQVTKDNIFHCLYAVLHHPVYRERFAGNLKKELPRIPYAPDFHAYAKIGAQLMDLHINYESVEPWPLQETINRDTPYTRAVTGKMKLSKDRASLQFNESITLHPIPPEAFDYKLGNRSALEWIIDQYQLKRDATGSVASDPNREDDPAYIFHLVGRVIRVSLETLRLVKSLPDLFENPA